MRQRGKISAARLEVLAPVAELQAAPEAPGTLNAEQAAVWRKLCGQMPANWFRPETHAMLETLCAVTVQLSQVNAEFLKFASGLPKGAASWRRYRALTAMRGQLTVQLGSLQTKLRLTPASRVEPHVAGRKARDQAEKPNNNVWDSE